MTGELTARAGSAVRIRFEGMDRASPPLRRWISLVLDPLREEDTASDPGLELRLVLDGPGTGPARTLPPLPGGLVEGRFVVADHLGRVAHLPLEAIGREPARVDGGIDPSFFQSWVYFPLLRAALYRVGGALVHAAAVELDGRRIAMTGWGGTGKTSILLELLSRGANLLADDWMALLPDGVAAPVTGHLEIERFQWDRTVKREWPGRPTWVRTSAVGTARWASRRLRRTAGFSRGLARVAEAWHPDTLWVPVQDAFPASRVADPGSVDAMIVLVPPGAQSPSDRSIPEVVAVQTQTFLSDHAALEAALRYARPGALGDPLFPTQAEEVEIVTKGLARSRVAAISFDAMHGDVGEAADRVVALAREQTGSREDAPDASG